MSNNTRGPLHHEGCYDTFDNTEFVYAIDTNGKLIHIVRRELRSLPSMPLRTCIEYAFDVLHNTRESSLYISPITLNDGKSYICLVDNIPPGMIEDTVTCPYRTVVSDYGRIYVGDEYIRSVYRIHGSDVKHRYKTRYGISGISIMIILIVVIILLVTVIVLTNDKKNKDYYSK
jgi:hypothetical protein